MGAHSCANTPHVKPSAVQQNLLIIAWRYNWHEQLQKIVPLGWRTECTVPIYDISV